MGKNKKNKNKQVTSDSTPSANEVPNTQTSNDSKNANG